MNEIIGLVLWVEVQVAHHEFIRSACPSAILVDIVASTLLGSAVTPHLGEDDVLYRRLQSH